MANISFYATTQQFIDRTKIVTRRFAWWNLKPGQKLCGIEKGQGLKKDEKINRLHNIEIISALPECVYELANYPDPQAELAKEGFPDMTPADFIEFLCKMNKKKPGDLVNRIEFIHL